jgi:hypothetical protein
MQDLCHSVTSLDLAHCGLVGPIPSFKCCLNLQHLALQGNKFEEDLAHFVRDLDNYPKDCQVDWEWAA